MVTLAAMMLINTAAMAQDKGKDERKPDKTEMVKTRTQHMATRYNLTDKQTKKLLELNTKHAEKMGGLGNGRGMRPNGNRQRDGRKQMTEEQRKQMQEMRQQRQKSMEAYKKELKKILTDEQMKQYENDETQFRNRRGRGGHR